MSNKGRTASEETRQKMSLAHMGKPYYGGAHQMSPANKAAIIAAHTGKPLSPETKAKISAANKGENHGSWGKHRSEETRAKISASNVGKHHQSDDTKRAISEAQRGRHPSDETRAKMSLSRTGLHPTHETRVRLSIRQLGETNHNWQGGKSYEPYCPKWTKELRERIRAFFEYRCALCGKTTEDNTKKLCCHHVEYDKQACCDGKPVQFTALCSKCHSKTNHDRGRWEAMFHRAIDEIWNGKSYYTKTEWNHVAARSAALGGKP
jgi:hypothetical protein